MMLSRTKKVLLLLLGLAGVAGCSSVQDALLEPYLRSLLAFDTSALSQETLDGLLQDIDQSVEDQGVTVTVDQTMGDPLALQVFYTVALPEGTDLEHLIPADVTLTSAGNPLPYSACGSSSDREILQEDGMLACNSYFVFDKEIVTPGMEVSFTVSGINRNGELAFDTTHTFTWTVENEGPVRYLDLKNDQGDMAGTCVYSSLALNASLWDWDPDQTTPPVKLLDGSGSVIKTNASRSGGGFNVQLMFRKAVDLDNVHAIQVGPYTTEVP